MLKNIILVGVGGFVGSSLRYIISYFVSSAATSLSIPIATLIVNIVGSLTIGILLTTIRAESIYFFAVMGICGGFTTFSTFSAEALGLMRNNMWNHAILYIVISVVVCILATLLGMYIGSRTSGNGF